MAVDNQYVRRKRQHIPFYKDEDFNGLSPYSRDKWHHLRSTCEEGCVWGIPIVQGQYLMFYIEDDVPTDVSMDFAGGGQNTLVQFCCIPEGLISNDPEDCNTIVVEDVQEETFSNHNICVIDGQPIQRNYVRFKLPDDAPCGLWYIKILAYNTLAGSLKRIYYSQPIEVFSQDEVISKKMVRVSLFDECGVGGIDWSKGTDAGPQWEAIGGFSEVLLPQGTRVSFIDKVSDEEVEEDGLGNEVPIFESMAWRYQFDTGFVPDHYAEFIHELALVREKTITMLDSTAVKVFGGVNPVVSPHTVEISRVETDMTPDGDGCYMNVNVQYQINKYNKKSCCEVDECECPQDNAVEVQSYTDDQDTAEANAVYGQSYLVPDGAAGPSNPDWATQQNKLATWSSGGWIYTVPTYRQLYYAKDSTTYYIQTSPGVAPLSPDLLLITNKTQTVPASCEWVIEAAIPFGTFAKIQYKIGVGAWTDFDGVYHNSDDWDGGITISTPQDTTYDLRLVPLDIGCSLQISPEDQVIQSIACI